ncbi:hypothetical protein [Nocardioides sp. YIM 152588]|uniref:hypothetical protein n=1 Tax=Nocardioides sp. YIM 152588 TaxID=3158259 RepID=UPI0032E3D839
MSRSTVRRKPSSSGATARPRKLAGQGGAGAGAGVPVVEAPEVEAPRVEEPVEEAVVEEPVVEEPAGEPAVASGTPRRPRSLLAGRRVTRALVALLACLGVVLALQGAWFALVHDPAPAAEAASTTAAERAEIEVPDGRPVVPAEADVQGCVDAAAKALGLIVSKGFKTYDKDVDRAAATMTERFAAEYRETTDQIRDEFIANRTQVQSRVVAQGVVRANDTQVEALVFLNQYATKGKKGDERTTYTPYRAVVTVVNTDRGCLVDGLDTK